MQGKQNKVVKNRASTPKYVSPLQLTIAGFETPFEQNLDNENRWIKMAKGIPWDSVVSQYNKLFTSKEGRPPISGRVILGSIIIKHLGNLSDRETIAQIQENVYLQYFLGYSSFTTEAPFSPSLFVEIRERLSMELLNKINEEIVLKAIEQERENEAAFSKKKKTKEELPPNDDAKNAPIDPQSNNQPKEEHKGESNLAANTVENKGKLLVDATVAPQNITFPTDLKLLNAAREKSEELIDRLYNPKLHGLVKVRTYRESARKDYLNAAKKRKKSRKQINRANEKQLRYLRRNLKHIIFLLDACSEFPLKPKEQKYLLVLQTVYEQQDEMYRKETRRIDHRIVNIHQPHVRPIVRGKEKVKTEFGAKIQMCLVLGYTFIDHLSWEAFNEGGFLVQSVEAYKRRFGFYPAEVLVDQIYCNACKQRCYES